MRISLFCGDCFIQCDLLDYFMQTGKNETNSVEYEFSLDCGIIDAAKLITQGLVKEKKLDYCNVFLWVWVRNMFLCVSPQA